MKLKCNVDITKHYAIAQGLRGRQGGLSSTVCLVKKRDIVFLVWRTVKNKKGTKYKITNNVEQVFSRFVSEGVGTVRLIDPYIDICISSANTTNIKRFLSAVRSARNGELVTDERLLSPTRPQCNCCSGNFCTKPKTKLIIKSKKDYRRTVYPTTLETLCVTYCYLATFDSRILKLRFLNTLILSGNEIKDLPGAIAEMQCLTELNLEDNYLTEIPHSFCAKSSNLCNTLRKLKLSDNTIRFLPGNFGNLKELTHLDICGNQLMTLPVSIGNMRNLKEILASKNRIKALPFTIKKLKLEKIDMAKNDFMAVGVPSVSIRLEKVPSLQELAARSITRNKVQYSDGDITHFCSDFLDIGRKCVFCPTYCFRSYVQMCLSLELHRLCQKVVHIDSNWRSSAPVHVALCSMKCLKRTGIKEESLSLR